MINIERSNAEALTTYTVVSFLSHAVVYAFLIHSVPRYGDGWQYLHWLCLFGICAFAVAPIVGIVADLTENCHRMAQCGVLLQFCGIFFPYRCDVEFLPLTVSVPIKVALLGIGFGLFHTFAATTILRRDCGKTSHLGIFLSSGTLGIAAIMILPTLGFYLMPFLLFAAALNDNCKLYGLSLPRRKETKHPALAALGVVLLLAVLILQSHALPGIDTVNPRDKALLLLVALALGIGKALGGISADLIGAPLTALCFPIGGAFLLSAGDSKAKLLVGILLCAASLPIIMKLVSSLIPSAPGFSFGLCTALLFPTAWLTVRQPEAFDALPISSLTGGILASVAVIAVALWCRRFGAVPAWAIKKYFPRIAHLVPDTIVPTPIVFPEKPAVITEPEETADAASQEEADPIPEPEPISVQESLQELMQKIAVPMQKYKKLMRKIEKRMQYPADNGSRHNPGKSSHPPKRARKGGKKK